MKNTDNSTNANGKAQTIEHGTQAKPEANGAGTNKMASSDAPQPMHLAQLETEANSHSGEANHAASGVAPATIVLAAVGDDLPTPLLTEQSNAPAQNQEGQGNQNQNQAGEVSDQGGDAAQNAGQSQEQPQNATDNTGAENVPGESTLLSQADLQNLDSTAAGNPIGDSIEEPLANPFGNLDAVEDTRYDWDRGTPPEDFKVSFAQDFTPAVAAAPFNPVPIANDDFIGSVIRGSCCERETTDKVSFDGKGKGYCGSTYNELQFNILPNDILSPDAPNVISSITFIQGGNPVTLNTAQFDGTLIQLDDGSSFTLHADGSLSYTGPNNPNNGELPGAPETVKIFDYILSDNTPDSDPASVYVKIYEPPVVQIGDACAVEGNQLAFNVTLYGELPPGFVLKIPYYTYDGSAQDGPDYTGDVNYLTFVGVEGQTSQSATVYINTLTDDINECSENMFIHLDTSCTIVNECSYLNDFNGQGTIFDQPEKIPEQTICSNYFGLFQVYEAGLPDGTHVGNTNTQLTGNVFDDFNLAGYSLNQIDIHIQQALNPLFVLNDSNPDAVTLTNGHAIFTIDTSNNGIGTYGAWTYELTGSVTNPLPASPEGEFNQNFLEYIKLTLCPLPADCNSSNNYEDSNNPYNSSENGCTPPTPECTDVTLKVKIVDDVQIPQNDCYEVPVCSGDCAPSITDTSFKLTSAPSEEGLGSFDAVVSWNGTTLTITLTNNSATAGFLTGLLIDIPHPELLNGAHSTSDADFQFMSVPINGNQGQPFNPTDGTGHYDLGYALGGNWEGGGSPQNGIPANGSVTFTFNYGANNGLSILDFYNQFNDLNTDDNVSNFIVRFKGFADGGSDKVGAEFVCGNGTDGHDNIPQSITGNVLDNDTPSADRIADGPNAHNGMTVFFVAGPGFVGGALSPDVDNTFTTDKGSTFVIREDGSFDYTPAAGLTENEVITYFSRDGDGSIRSAEVTFKPVENYNDVPVAVDDCACEGPSTVPETWSIVINFNGTNADYNSSFGYYIKDANGFPTEGKIVWEGVKDGIPNNELVLNQDNMQGVNPCDIGYFIIPDGWTKNNGVINDGTAVTFLLDNQGHWQAQTANGNIPLTGQDSNIYFDNGNLNIDNYPHMSNVGNGNFNWEDLFNGGDADFNDVQVNIQNNFNCPTCEGIVSPVYGNLLDNDHLSTDGGNRVESIAFGNQSFLVPEGGSVSINQDDVTGESVPFVLIVYSDGEFTFNPGLNNTQANQHLEFKYTLADINGDSSTANFCFDVAPQQSEENIPNDANIIAPPNDDLPAPIASDDGNSVSETHLAAGSDPDASLLSVSGNILANDSFGAPVQIVNIGGINVTGGDLASGFKIVSTAHGDMKVFLVDGNGHAQGDYVYTLTSASADASDSVSYSILSNNQLSSASILISIADDAPSAASHDVTVWEQPIVAGQSDGVVVSTGNVLDGAKSGADVLPVSYAPKTAVDAISFEVLNLSNANQAAYLALGAVITVLSGNISKVALAVPLNGDISFGLPDGASMTIGSDGYYSLHQPVGGISADKSYAFSYEITDNDGSKAEADLNVTVKNFNAPIANEDNIWTFDSGTKTMNVFDNDVLSSSATVREVTYKDEHNLTKTISVPQSGNGNNAWASFTTHSGAEVKIDKNGNVQYKPDNVSRGHSEMDVMSYKVVESGNGSHSAVGEIKAHVFDRNADFEHLNGDHRNNTLDATDLTGTVAMTGNGGKNEFKIDLGNASRSNDNPSDVIITDLFKSGATNSLTFTHVSNADGKPGLGIGDIISSINTVSQVSPNGDIHVNFNNGTNLSIQDPGFTMSMPTANEFIQQLQEHSIQVSAQN